MIFTFNYISDILLFLIIRIATSIIKKLYIFYKFFINFIVIFRYADSLLFIGYSNSFFNASGDGSVIAALLTS